MFYYPSDKHMDLNDVNLSTSIDPNQEGENASHFMYVLTPVTIKTLATIRRWKHHSNFSAARNNLAWPAIV